MNNPIKISFAEKRSSTQDKLLIVVETVITFQHE